MMDRRASLGSLTALAAPLAAEAQTARMPRVGLLDPGQPRAASGAHVDCGGCASIGRRGAPIDLKAAKALGLTIPPSLLQRADAVID